MELTLDDSFTLSLSTGNKEMCANCGNFPRQSQNNPVKGEFKEEKRGKTRALA